MHETNDAEKLQELMVRDDIAMLLCQSGFGNEWLTLDTKCKAVQSSAYCLITCSKHDVTKLRLSWKA